MLDDITPASNTSGPHAFAAPPFRPRLPWLGGDLQTLRNFLTRRRPDLLEYPAQPLSLPVDDGSGDVLLGTLHQPAERAAARPLVVLIHGLTGCEGSSYILNSADYLLARGHAVLRLNLRGAGAARSLCRLRYHAGRTEDLQAALTGLDAELIRHGLAFVGYSLGANMLLKFLAEHGRHWHVRAAAAVSAPIDLAAASRRIMEPRNTAYHAWLLTRMKQDLTGPLVDMTKRDRRALALTRTIWDLDDQFVAPRNSYPGAAAYYAANSALQFLPSIRVPTLAIHAQDDPWIPSEAYRGFDWSANPALHPVLPERGGHVGFHGRGDRVAWHDRIIADFIAAT